MGYRKASALSTGVGKTNEARSMSGCDSPMWRSVAARLSAVLVALTGSATILAGSSSGQANGQLAADTVFLDGQVLLYPRGGNLMSHNVSWAQAVAVKDGRITFVGDNRGARKRIGPGTKVIDLGGRILMPGLGD